MLYGKELEEKSYENGKVKKVQRKLEESLIVKDKSALLSAVLDSLKKVETGETYELTITIFADPQTHAPRRVVRKWLTERAMQ